MKTIDIPYKIKDKIFEIKYTSKESVFKIISYFPLSELECRTLTSQLKQPNFPEFYSIFTDNVTDDQWNKTKDQIKKRFQNELFDIDSKL